MSATLATVAVFLAAAYVVCRLLGEAVALWRRPRNWLIVRDPMPRFLPGFVRRWLGEEYMTVDILPSFTSDMRAARVFPSRAWAMTYLVGSGGAWRPYAENCICRSTRLPAFTQEEPKP